MQSLLSPSSPQTAHYRHSLPGPLNETFAPSTIPIVLLIQLYSVRIYFVIVTKIQVILKYKNNDNHYQLHVLTVTELPTRYNEHDYMFHIDNMTNDFVNNTAQDRHSHVNCVFTILLKFISLSRNEYFFFLLRVSLVQGTALSYISH